MKLTDVSGQFQLNEPIEIDGLDVGRNITALSDHDISDVKSIGRTVGLSTFAANTALISDKKSFTESSQFSITSGGAATSPSVSNFSSLVKVCDIVRYSKPSGTLPTFNRVASGVYGRQNLAIPSVAVLMVHY